MRLNRQLCFLILAFILIAVPVLAYPSFFDSRCASCHSDDTPTCNGCHHHRGSLTATADQSSYLPGAAVGVTLDGGTQHGWIRALLYDQNDLLVDIASGPTGMGDDSGSDPVTFPVSLTGTAPSEPGTYLWKAAWFGNDNGSGHYEYPRNVTIIVESDGTGLPPSEELFLDWKAIKSLY